jgi:hypothetical protein
MKDAAALAEKTAGSIDAKSKGEIDKILKASSDAMADVQDKLIGRTKQQRENLQKAIKDGTYADKLKLADKFDDIRDGSGGKGKDREKENLNASAVTKKLSLADAILKSKKMKLALEKRAAMDNSLIEAKLKAAQQKLNDARAKVGLSEVELTTDTATSTATETGSAVATNYGTSSDTSTGTSSDTATVTDTDTGTGLDVDVEGALEELDEEMVDGIIGAPGYDYIYEAYKELDKCGGFLDFFCDHDVKIDGDWYEIDTRHNQIKVTTTVERRGGLCYKNVEKCGKEMIPCDLSKGKACKATFKPYGCKTVSEPVACPKNK